MYVGVCVIGVLAVSPAFIVPVAIDAKVVALRIAIVPAPLP
jgi:hypothetical protein